MQTCAHSGAWSSTPVPWNLARRSTGCVVADTFRCPSPSSLDLGRRSAWGSACNDVRTRPRSTVGALAPTNSCRLRAFTSSTLGTSPLDTSATLAVEPRAITTGSERGGQPSVADSSRCVSGRQGPHSPPVLLPHPRVWDTPSSGCSATTSTTAAGAARGSGGAAHAAGTAWGSSCHQLPVRGQLLGASANVHCSLPRKGMSSVCRRRGSLLRVACSGNSGDAGGATSDSDVGFGAGSNRGLAAASSSSSSSSTGSGYSTSSSGGAGGGGGGFAGEPEGRGLPPPVIISPQALRVVVIGWMGSSRRYLNKYGALWARSGDHEVLMLRPTVLQTLVRWRGVVVAGRDIDRVARMHRENPAMPTVYHVFSTGGFIHAGTMWRWMDEVEDVAQRRDMLEEVRGIIFDSAPAAVNPEMAARAMVSAVTNTPAEELTYGMPGLKGAMLSGTRSFLASYLQTKGVKLRTEEVYDAWYNLAPVCPQLYLYSDADPLVPPADVERYMAVQEGRGVPVSSHVFRGSGHVEHFRRYPHEYAYQISAFLTRALQDW